MLWNSRRVRGRQPDRPVSLECFERLDADACRCYVWKALMQTGAISANPSFPKHQLQDIEARCAWLVYQCLDIRLVIEQGQIICNQQHQIAVSFENTQLWAKLTGIAQTGVVL